MNQEHLIKHMIYVFCENEIVYDTVMDHLRAAKTELAEAGLKLELNWGDLGA